MPIKWRKQDLKKLSQYVGKFNAKITRELRKNPEAWEYYPAKISVKEIKAQIETREDYNRFIKSIDRAFKPGGFTPVENKEGTKTTKWMLNEINISNRFINRERQKIREKANPSYYTGTMGSVEANALKPRKFNFDKMNENSFNKYVESTRHQARSQYWNERIMKYKEDYLANIKKHFNMEDKKVKQLYELVKNIPADIMFFNYYADAELQINFFSDPIEAELLVERALNAWRTFLLV